MTRDEVFQAAAIMINNGQRNGQAVFNVVAMVFPEVANPLRGSAFDCYYRDERIDLFLSECGIY